MSANIMPSPGPSSKPKAATSKKRSPGKKKASRQNLLSAGSHPASKAHRRAKKAGAQAATQTLSPLDIAKKSFLITEPDPELIDAIANLAVGAGVTPDIAARSLGISFLDFRSWVIKGLEEIADPKSNYALLVKTLDVADAMDEVSDLKKISSGDKSWQAAAWKRERRSAQRWGPKVDPSTGVIIPPPKVEDTMPTLDHQAEVLAILEMVTAPKIST